MDEQQPQEQQPVNPFSPDAQAAETQVPVPDQEGNANGTSASGSTDSNVPANSDVSTGTDAGNDQSAAQPVEQPAVSTTPDQSSAATDAGQTSEGNAQAPQESTSSTSPAQSSGESETATSDAPVAADALAVMADPSQVPNVRTAPVETVDVNSDEAQSPAAAPQPQAATVVATGDPDVPAKVVQVEQPATIPDPDPNADKGAEVPNPNVMGTQNAEIPSTLNPDATNSPAPITPAERVAHIEIQQNTAPGESVTTTQLSGDYTASATSQAEQQGTNDSHESILAHLMRDLEGISAMGKSEIIAVLAMARARFEDLLNGEK